MAGVQDTWGLVQPLHAPAWAALDLEAWGCFQGQVEDCLPGQLHRGRTESLKESDHHFFLDNLTLNFHLSCLRAEICSQVDQICY